MITSLEDLFHFEEERVGEIFVFSCVLDNVLIDLVHGDDGDS